MKRLTAVFVAAVFVLGTAFIPSGIYAAEAQEGDLVQPESRIIDIEGLEEIDESEYNGFLFRLKDDSTKAEISELEGNMESLGSGQEAEVVLEDELYTADSLDTIEEIAQPEMIESIEPNYIMTLQGEINDPYYSKYKWQLEMTGIPTIWEEGLDGSGAVVAVVDTGVYTGHEDFEGTKFVKKYNVYADSTNVADYHGHGTSVTGTIVGAKNNGLGFAGAMPGVSIMPIKVFSNTGYSDTSYAIKAVERAVSNGADVINMSVATDYYSGELERACEAAVDAGVIVVAAAGNDAEDGNPDCYPAAYSSVISVGSVDKNEEWSSFSTYNSGVTVVAPGEGVLVMSSSGGYGTSKGTSFSAPQVSALAAVLKSCNHSMTQSEFMQILEESSKDLGDPGRDDYYGYGLVDFVSAFQHAISNVKYYSVDLSTTLYNYNGNVKTPGVTVGFGGTNLVKGTDYTVAYASGRKAVGTYKVTVTGTGDYSGSKTKTFTIRPPLVKAIRKPLSYKKKITVRWNAMTKAQKTKYKSAVTGYQVRVSKSTKFSSSKSVKVKGIAKSKATVKNLKRKTTYYVQYRTYKTVGSRTFYSKWSKSKKIKTK